MRTSLPALGRRLSLDPAPIARAAKANVTILPGLAALHRRHLPESPSETRCIASLLSMSSYYWVARRGAQSPEGVF